MDLNTLLSNVREALAPPPGAFAPMFNFEQVNDARPHIRFTVSNANYEAVKQLLNAKNFVYNAHCSNPSTNACYAYTFRVYPSSAPGSDINIARAKQEAYMQRVKISNLCSFLKRKISEEDRESDEYTRAVNEYHQLAEGNETSTFIMPVNTLWNTLSEAQRKEKDMLKKLHDSICR